MKNIFFKTNSQKVLVFLSQYPTKEFLASEIKEKVHLSRAGINFALQELTNNKLITRKAKGKAYVYQARAELSVIKQLKVLINIIDLEPLVKVLSEFTDKIVLFGSCSRGENTEDSDVDLLIVSHSKDEIKERLKKFRKIQVKAIIKTNAELERLSKDDAAFYGEINRGIILFEKRDEY
jgi:predicted nucleotidyltransferase